MRCRLGREGEWGGGKKEDRERKREKEERPVARMERKGEGEEGRGKRERERTGETCRKDRMEEGRRGGKKEKKESKKSRDVPQGWNRREKGGAKARKGPGKIGGQTPLSRFHNLLFLSCPDYRPLSFPTSYAYPQAYAAEELYRREWRFHKDMKLWVKLEKGEYFYFDINNWYVPPCSPGSPLSTSSFALSSHQSDVFGVD